MRGIDELISIKALKPDKFAVLWEDDRPVMWMTVMNTVCFEGARV